MASCISLPERGDKPPAHETPPEICSSVGRRQSERPKQPSQKKTAICGMKHDPCGGGSYMPLRGKAKTASDPAEEETGLPGRGRHHFAEAREHRVCLRGE